MPNPAISALRESESEPTARADEERRQRITWNSGVLRDVSQRLNERARKICLACE
jgi:hypothetical protein